ncbi:MAG: winged helix-turn-helix transcriptional regulator [Acidobacteria bacterium]|nr:winged helix-turn-helix transcriptional regulator [Acidobacteriota bacterium]
MARKPPKTTNTHRSGKASVRAGSNHTHSLAERQPIYRLQAEICRVLGHPERLAIIDLLKNGELPASELRRLLGIGKVNLSRHLKALRQVGLVDGRSRGREALYSLAFCEIGAACSGIREVLALRLHHSARLAETFLPRKPRGPRSNAQKSE